MKESEKLKIDVEKLTHDVDYYDEIGRLCLRLLQRRQTSAIDVKC